MEKIMDALMRLDHEVKAKFGEEGLKEIKFTPEVFDSFICELHKKANSYASSFSPSAIHEFKLFGIKISPKFKE